MGDRIDIFNGENADATVFGICLQYKYVYTYAYIYTCI